jgi:hypothetical protein
MMMMILIIIIIIRSLFTFIQSQLPNGKLYLGRMQEKHQKYNKSNWHECKISRSHYANGLRHEPSSPLERWDRMFESHSGHGRLCEFTLCVGSGLATG